MGSYYPECNRSILDMGQSEKTRVFIAIKPPDDWLGEIELFQSRLKKSLPWDPVKWVKSEQLHVTLRFFGWLTQKELGKAIETTEASAQHRSFVLSLGDLGCFLSIHRPRVLWIGLKGDVNACEDLHSQIIQCSSEIGQPPEDRKFIPHLTLARFKDLPKTVLPALTNVLQEPNFSPSLGPWHVDELLVLSSQISPQGATYELLRAIRLREPKATNCEFIRIASLSHSSSTLDNASSTGVRDGESWNQR